MPVLTDVVAATTPSRARIARHPDGFLAATWAHPWRLTEDACDAVQSALVDVSTRAFGADMAPYWRDRRAGGYFDSIARFCFLAAPDGEVIGWTGYHRHSFGGQLCLYLDSSGVVPEYSRSGLMKRVQLRLVGFEVLTHPTHSLYLATRTENPVVYRALASTVGRDRIFPSPYRPPTEVARAIARDVARFMGQEDKLVVEELVIRGAYDNLDALYGEIPRCGDPKLDALFARLGPLDAFVVVTDIGVATLLRARVRGRTRDGADRRAGEVARSLGRRRGGTPAGEPARLARCATEQTNLIGGDGEDVNQDACHGGRQARR